MPNWPLNYPAQAMLRDRVHQLTQRALDYALTEFPLNTARVQSLTMSDEHVTDLRRLECEGIKTIAHHQRARVLFSREQFPGLRRHAVLDLQLPQGIYVKVDTSWRIGETKFSLNGVHYLLPRMDTVDEKEHAALTVWVNRAVRQTRLKELTDRLAADIVPGRAPTAAHLRAFWPTLTSLFDGSKPTAGRYADEADWAERMRNLPKHNLSIYTPDKTLHEKYRPLMLAADSVLLAAQLLSPITRNQAMIQPSVEHWEKRTGDPRVPPA